MTREDAIEEIKCWDLTPGERETLEALIPELRETESEDEMIRESLIKYFQDYAPNSGWSIDFSNGQVQDWLKRIKPIWTDEDESFVKHILPRILEPKDWTLDQQNADKKLLVDFVNGFKSRYLVCQKGQKQVISDGSDIVAKAIQDNCKELAETEDERMLRIIIGGFQNWRSNGNVTFNNTSVDDIIAWLEKQKLSEWSDLDKEMLDRIIERGSVEVPPHTRALCSDHIQWLQWLKEGRIVPKQKEQKPELCDMGRWDEESYNNGIHHVLQNPEAYGLTKQKPADIAPNQFDGIVYGMHGHSTEKQDYSGLTDLERAIHRGFLCAGVENVSVTIIKETAQECLAQMKPAEWSGKDRMNYEVIRNHVESDGWATAEQVDFYRSLSPNTSPEWSEEDEKTWEDIKDHMIYGSFIPIDKIKWIDSRFKSLRPQQKEQDAEKYSEDKSFEDEWKDYYNNSLVSLLPKNKREVARHFYWFAKKNAWKPSEEQVADLEYIVKDLRGAYLYRERLKSIDNLIENLKKQM